MDAIILSVEQVGLNPYCYGISSLTHLYNTQMKTKMDGLNPYCYGISSLTKKIQLWQFAYYSLNPYCYGISSLT